jgi:hypothetical protein
MISRESLAMTGLGLIHVGFLFATAAVAAPILIHLLFKPRARRVQIGSLRFLKRALKDRVSRRKLRRWFLLALRVAAVLLLALLFARPYFGRAGTQGQEREVILLIDQSASMSATQGGRTFFDRAQEAAEKIKNDLPNETAIHLGYFDALGVVALAEARIDASRQPGYAGTDYLQALRWARDIVVNSKRPQRTIYLFTDLQRSGVRESAFDGLPSDVELEVVEIGKAILANLAVESVETIDSLIRPKQPLLVVAHLLNAGQFPAKKVQVRLVLESETGTLPAQVETVDLAPASWQAVRFSTPIQKPGLYKGYVEIASADDFPLDNRRYLAIDARLPDRLLLVDGEPGSSVYSNGTYYLEAALRLRLPHKGGSITPYEPERLAWVGGATLPDLQNFRVVVLCNVASMPEQDVLRLRRFVAEGGNLLFFTGKQVQAEGYEPFQRAGLLPASVAGPTGPAVFRFDKWEKEHPILKPLSDPQQGDLRRVYFDHVTKLQLNAGVKVLAAAQTGEPLLIESRLERGTILFFASAGDREWSNWPQSRLYVPLVHQLIGYLTERLPENQRVQEKPAGSGQEMEPGIIVAGKAVVVRNLDPKESEIERLTEEQFRKGYHLPVLDPNSVKRRAAAAVKTPAGTERADEVWTYVIWILLVVLIGELFIANRTHA